MGDARQQDRVQVVQHGVEAFAVFGWVGRQRGPNFAGLDRGQHRKGLEPLVVRGDPLDGLVAIFPELVRRHVIGHASQSYLIRTRKAHPGGSVSAAQRQIAR